MQSEIQLRGADPPRRPRSAKTFTASEAQRFANQKRSWQQLELLLAVNFPTPGSGIVGVATFDDAHRPVSRRETQRRFKYFLKKIRIERQRLDLPPPVVIETPEVLTSESGHWHTHFVIDATGHDFALLRRCWIYGSDLDLRLLRVDSRKNHQSLARYLTKELREVQDYASRPGLHGWSCTRNARRPEVDVMIVDDSFRLEIPAGCESLQRDPNVIKYRSAL